MKPEQILARMSGHCFAEALESARLIVSELVPLQSSAEERKQMTIFLAQEYCLKVLHGHHIFELDPMQVIQELQGQKETVDLEKFALPYPTVMFWGTSGFGRPEAPELLVEQWYVHYQRPKQDCPPTFYITIVWAGRNDRPRFHTDVMRCGKDGGFVCETQDSALRTILVDVLKLTILVCARILARRKEVLPPKLPQKKGQPRVAKEKRISVMKLFGEPKKVREQAGNSEPTTGNKAVCDVPAHYQHYWVKPENVGKKLEHWQAQGRQVEAKAGENEKGFVAIWLEKLPRYANGEGGPKTTKLK